jgi:hypothetical protein
MATYWMTFRLGDDDAAKRATYGDTHDDRYDALVDEIRRHSSRWWEEATSFILFESSHDISSLARACKTAIDPNWDVVLIHDLDKKSSVVVGNAQDQALFVLMPYAKKV